jgi:hypothetical protein
MVKPGLPKLIATDLDGTLVRSDDSVSAYTHEVLGRVRAAGIRIVGATGRGPRLTGLVRNDIRDADFLVLAQGGWVIDQQDGAVLRSERLSGHDLAAALADLEAEVGPLSVMVEALEHDDSPLWGDYDPTWRYPVVRARRRQGARRGPADRAAGGGVGHPGRPRLHRDQPAERGQRHRAGGRRAGGRRRPGRRARLR